MLFLLSLLYLLHFILPPYKNNSISCFEVWLLILIGLFSIANRNNGFGNNWFAIIIGNSSPNKFWFKAFCNSGCVLASSSISFERDCQKFLHASTAFDFICFKQVTSQFFDQSICQVH